MGDLIPIIEGPAKIRDGKKVGNMKVWFHLSRSAHRTLKFTNPDFFV